MSRSNNGPQVVGILNAVEENQQLGSRKDTVEFGIALCGSVSYYALVCGAVGSAIKRLARLEAHRYGTLASEIDDFLETRPTGAASDQNSIERTSRAQRFTYRMNAGQKAAGLPQLRCAWWFALRKLPV